MPRSASFSKECKIKDCSNLLVGKGYCSLHYQRLRRTGDPLTPPGRRTSGRLRWLREAIKVETDDCIIIPDIKRYGSCIYEGQPLRMHVVALLLTGSPKPSEEAVARHLCPGKENPSCVNPRHLKWGTDWENRKDAYERGAVKGRPITEAEVLWAIERQAEGFSYRNIAKVLGVSTSGITSRVRILAKQIADHPNP